MIDASSYLKSFEDVYVKKSEEIFEAKTFKTFIFVKTKESLNEKEGTPYKIFHTAKKRGLKPIFIVSESSSINLFSSPATLTDHEGGEHKVERGDLVFNRVNVGDTFGSGLVLAAKQSGAFILNRFESCFISENKYLSTHLLKDSGFDVPDSFVITKEQEDLNDIVKKIQTPVVLKSFYGSGGVGVSLVETRRSFLSHVQNYLESHDNVLVQKYIESDADYRILVLNGKAIAGVKRSTSEFDFRSNLSLGAKHSPYKPDQNEIETCERISKIFGLYYCAIDYIKKGNKLFILEVNCYPGSNDDYHSLIDDKTINGEQLIGHVFDEISDTDNWRPEPVSVNLVENIQIKDVGEFEAKMDTGNDSVTSLHAEKIEFLGSKVRFKINGKTYTKPIVDTVKIRQGEQVERRYVVHFDVLFHGMELKDVPFNLNDRTNMNYDVLIGVKFLSDNNLCVLPY